MNYWYSRTWMILKILHLYEFLEQTKLKYHDRNQKIISSEELIDWEEKEKIIPRWWECSILIEVWVTQVNFSYTLHSRFGEGNGNPLQYSCLENPMDRGTWLAKVRGVTKSWTQLKQTSTLKINVSQCVNYTSKNFLMWNKIYLKKLLKSNTLQSFWEGQNQIISWSFLVTP